MVNLHTLTRLRLWLSVAVIFLLFLNTHTSNLSAQSEDDLVYATMHNNQQFVGKVVSQNDEVILLSLDGVNDTLSLRRSMIEGINSANNKIILNNGRYHKRGGQSYALGLGLGETDSHICSLIELVSYRYFKQKIGLGGGVGVRFYSDGNRRFRNLNFGDVFGYGKLYLTNKRRRLFLDTKVGYAISLMSFEYVGERIGATEVMFRSEYTSGFVTQPGIGLELATKEKLKWSVKINMVFHNTHVRRGPIDPTEIVDRRRISNFIENLNFPSIHLGFYI